MKKILSILAVFALVGGGCSVKRPSQGTTPVVEQPTSGVELDLSGQGLTSIPMDVFSRTNLRRLDLSNNKLTGAPPSQIGQLTNLEFLDLSANDLTGLPAELGRLKNLEFLNVANNQLTGLPFEIGNLTNLLVFNVSGNNYSRQDLDQIAAKLPERTTIVE